MYSNRAELHVSYTKQGVGGVEAQRSARHRVLPALKQLALQRQSDSNVGSQIVNARRCKEEAGRAVQVWAFATMGHTPGEALLDGIATEAVRKVEGFNPQVWVDVS